MSPNVSVLGGTRNMLGESPVWDAEAGKLFWVDSVARRVCRSGPGGEAIETWSTPSMVGSLALGEDGLLVALEDGFHRLDLTNGTFAPLALPERENSAVRFNDGKADRQGRFLAGTMRVAGVEGAPGKLYRLEPDGSTSVLERGIQIANSLCFSPAGDIMYFADSLQHCIWAYDYDVGTGAATHRRVLIETGPLSSAPDGATVDAEGFLWVALVQAQKLARISPDGRAVLQIDVPVPYPSCPAFGGEDFSTLYVTTISDSRGLFKSDHADAGHILAVTGLGARGISESRCKVGAAGELAA